MTQPKLDPTLYILTLLKQNDGVYNLYRMDRRQFKNETERFAGIDTLVQNGSISKVQGGIGQTYRLTDKGEKHLYQLYFQKVLQHLADHDDTFQHVSGILKELSISDTSDDLADAIDLKLRRDKLVFETEESGVMLNENGRHFLAEQKFGLTEQNQATHITNSGVLIQGSRVSHSSFLDFAKSLPTQAANAPTTNSDQKGNWLLKILSNNWTVTIIGGIIVGLIVAYFIFVFKWNK